MDSGQLILYLKQYLASLLNIPIELVTVYKDKHGCISFNTTKAGRYLGTDPSELAKTVAESINKK
jgi:hypothetical protein